jgi:hypothetical protein
MEWADTRVTHLTYFDRLATTVELLGAAVDVLVRLFDRQASSCSATPTHVLEDCQSMHGLG